MINRFYTPSLPQYTSQFVEDRTPWGEMLALEQTKIDRTQQSEQALAETDAMMAALMPGPQTRDIAQRATEKYRSRISKLIEENKGQMYSIPAMREITKLNADFRHDPQVKKVQLDREETPWYQKMRSNPMYPLMIDPNIDPETGDVRQLTEDDEYKPLATPYDINAILDEEMRKIPIVERQDLAYKDIKHETTGELLPMTITTRREVRGEEQYAPVRDGIFEKYSGLPGMTPELLQQRMADAERRNIVNNILEQGSQVSDRRTGAVSDKPYEPMTFPTAGEKVVNPGNIPASEKGGINTPGFFAKLGIKADKAYMNLSPNVKTFYEEAWDNPEAILNNKYITPEGKTLTYGNIMDPTNIIDQSMYENPFQTIEVWTSYFENKKKTVSGEELEKVEKQEKDIMDHIVKAANKFGVYDKGYQTDLHENRVLNAIKYAHFKGELDLNYDIEDLRSLSPMDKAMVNDTYIKIQKDVSSKAHYGKMYAFDDKVQSKWTAIFGGLTPDTNGVVKITGGVPAALSGATVIDPEADPGTKKHILSSDKVKDLFKKDAVFNVTGMLDNVKSQYGPGTFAVTMGSGKKGKSYLVKGPPETREPFELEYVTNTRLNPANFGEGDFFATRGINRLNNGVEYVDIVTRWNEREKGGDSGLDVYMNVAEDNLVAEYPVITLRVYSKDPRKSDDPAIATMWDEETNLSGYKPYILYNNVKDSIPATAAEPPDPRHVQYMVLLLWGEEMKKRQLKNK